MGVPSARPASKFRASTPRARPSARVPTATGTLPHPASSIGGGGGREKRRRRAGGGGPDRSVGSFRGVGVNRPNARASYRANAGGKRRARRANSAGSTRGFHSTDRRARTAQRVEFSEARETWPRPRLIRTRGVMAPSRAGPPRWQRYAARPVAITSETRRICATPARVPSPKSARLPTRKKTPTNLGKPSSPSQPRRARSPPRD